MNINEVEKHVKFDLIFSLLVILGVVTCLFLTLAVIFKPINAKALTETNVINGITAGQYCSSHPQASVCTAQIYQTGSGNPCGNGDSRCVTYFSAITDNKVMSVNFYLNTTIQGYTANTLTLYGTGFDNVSYGCSMSQSSCVVVRYSDHININFYNNNSTSLSNPVQFDIYSDSGFNSNKSFRLTGAKLFQNDIGDDSGGGSSSSFDDSGIINNANQNTQDIISNNNTNTQEITNSIFNFQNYVSDMLKNCYKNYLKDNSISLLVNMTRNGNSFTQVTADTRVPPQLSLLAYNNQVYLNQIGIYTTSSTGRYTFSFTKTENMTMFYLKFNGARIDTGIQINLNNLDLVNGVTYYLSVDVDNISQGALSFSKLMLTTKSNVAFVDFNKLYCTGNKLDGIEGAINGGLSDVNDNLEDVKNIEQDTYNYLTDDTNPTVNTGDIDNVIGQVQIQDPLNYLLTLPLNLLSKLNTLISSGTCSKASFGELYGTELYLPCINFENYLGSSLWSTIDTIVGIGLLVVILKKFYDTISNILSLGKEEEIRKGMELPTPMEFLAQILGGGR